MTAIPGLSSGAYAADLVQQHLHRIVELQTPVLEDTDPEPLHQLRVRFRRLRATLAQFAPALQLPETVTGQRLAKFGRSLGLARDLDVLRGRLEGELLPLLTPRELSNLKRVQKQLKRERRLAFEGLVETLRSKRYLQLIAALQGWLKQPLCTALGEEPVLSWLPEWKSAALTGLMLHPGWRCRGYGAAGDHEALHDLRKRIKAARYALTNLEELEGALLSSWIERFKAMQEQLGEFNDLLVLQRALEDQVEGDLDRLLPTLCSLILEKRAQTWSLWQASSTAMLDPQTQEQFRQMQLGSGPDQPSSAVATEGPPG
ncbi:CHAD domain-containing protein [Vulcanococcus limneticus]|uniref:CHAD domain-containing protein n=1 Tax=Vulcanococcus limneticus TaxID=2170428 RepID=UPI00398C09BC